MKYKIFGRKTGLRVSELALGTGNFGTRWGHGADPTESRRVFERYVDAGGNFIDTADTYQFGQSEEFVGELIASERDQLVLSSKFTLGAEQKAGISTTGNSRKNMIRSVEASLKRLKTDRIDVYWAHFSDGQTPLDELVRGFDDLVRSGKILYPGLSNFPAWRIASAATMADLRGWSPIAGIQIEYSLVERTPDRELLPMAEALGLGVAIWSPLGGGLLTGKYRAETVDTDSRLLKLGRVIRSEKSDRDTAVLDTLASIADETGVQALHIALAWLRHKADASATDIITILGPRTLSQLEDNLASLAVTLTDTQVQRLDEVSAVPLGYPHELIASTAARLNGGSSELARTGKSVY
jgi:aryl-alcohol dehydrogenase-like predicted oxidoreductase